MVFLLTSPCIHWSLLVLFWAGPTIFPVCPWNKTMVRTFLKELDNHQLEATNISEQKRSYSIGLINIGKNSNTRVYFRTFFAYILFVCNYSVLTEVYTTTTYLGMGWFHILVSRPLPYLCYRSHRSTRSVNHRVTQMESYRRVIVPVFLLHSWQNICCKTSIVPNCH